MKVLKITLIAILTPLFLLSQEAADKAVSDQGVIVYNRKVNMHAKLGPDQEEMKQFIPEFQTSKHQLFFTATTSVYKAYEEENEDLEIDHSPEEGVQMKIKMRAPENVVFRDFAENQIVEIQDFIGKKYLIEEESIPMAWKMAAEQKDILGYVCQKAIYEDTEKEQTIVAWFAPTLACPSGPESFAHLPGLILELDINEGEMVYELASLELKEIPEGTIAPPTEGKKITREKFKKIQEERLREMGAQGKGGIRMIIKH